MNLNQEVKNPTFSKEIETPEYCVNCLFANNEFLKRFCTNESSVHFDADVEDWDTCHEFECKEP